MSQNYTDSSSDTTDELWHTVINSDSDEELQMLCRAALEEEREKLRRKTRVHRGYIQGQAVSTEDESQDITGFTMTTLVKTLSTLPLNFEGGFECANLFFFEL
ncbi:hypothetical protein CKAN_00029800 [Cinnamomum micranthum f. kanehirae]|uniref:Uncharacterized protein n=1 Tax=Cinnamomum micranthum f. kanehirae TaxID=337451 RepID=A0A3S3LUZ0_9MAGN|nr:hypothetical protein CKAN_00029800 [Cinnamomum micranthum f. kanehirae]